MRFLRCSSPRCKGGSDDLAASWRSGWPKRLEKLVAVDFFDDFSLTCLQKRIVIMHGC